MTTVTLPRRLLPFALLVADTDCDGVDPDDGLAPHLARQLRQSGVVHGHQLTPSAHTVLSVMTTATTLVSIDVTTSDRRRRTTVWAGPGGAVWSQTRNDLVVLTEIGHIEVPLLLLQVTGLASRPVPAGPTPLRFTTVELDSIRDWAAIDAGAARRLVRAATGTDPGALQFLSALCVLRSEWSVCSSWLDPDGQPRTGTLDIIDGGDAGYWQIEHAAGVPGAATDVGTVVVTPRSTESVNRMLHRLLPRTPWRLAG